MYFDTCVIDLYVLVNSERNDSYEIGISDFTVIKLLKQIMMAMHFKLVEPSHQSPQAYG